MYHCLVIYLVSLTDQIYHLAASWLGDKCDRSMTLSKLLDNNAQFFIFIRPTCRDVLWYGAGVCLSVRLSRCLSVGLSSKLVNTIESEPFQLGPSNLVHILLMTRRRTLLIFNVRGQRSRPQATQLLNLVNTIQIRLFQLGPSNLVLILLMTRGRTILIFKVMGQRSRSHVRHCC